MNVLKCLIYDTLVDRYLIYDISLSNLQLIETTNHSGILALVLQLSTTECTI